MPKYLLIVFSLLVSNSTFAGVIVGATRVIYDESSSSESIIIQNKDNYPYLIQSWVEDDSDGSRANDKFIVTPPISKIPANSSIKLRIIKLTNELSNDKESLFWLNVMSVPPKSKDNENHSLSFAVRTRLKLIYRPDELIDYGEEVWQGVRWDCNNGKLTVTNDSSYYINFNHVKIGGISKDDIKYIEPFSSQITDLNKEQKCNVEWSVINDFGGISKIYHN